MATIGEALLLAFEHHQAGRAVEAGILLDRIIEADDTVADAWHLSGIVLAGLGRMDEAAARVRRAVALAGEIADYHANLGRILCASGRAEEGDAWYRCALALRPDFADAWAARAAAREPGDPAASAAASLRAARLQRARSAEEGERLARTLPRLGHHRDALCLRPDEAENWLALARRHQAGGQMAQAATAFGRAAALRAESAELWYHTACALEDSGQVEAAARALRRALALHPASAHVLFMLAHLAEQAYRLDAAIIGYRRVTALRPAAGDAHLSLGTALLTAGEVPAAIAAYRASVACDTGRHGAFSSLLFALCFDEDADLDAVYAEFRRFDAIHARPFTAGAAAPAAPVAVAPGGHDPDRRLRVGYVSPNFYGHPCGHFVLPVIEHHDPARVAVVCYATSPVRDAWTEEFERRSERFVPCHGLDDEALAERVRADGIDILVDCSGHMAGHRLLAFARRPAPIQVSYPLFPNTTGLTAMDYRIMDRHFAPPWADRWHSERLVRMPDAHVVYKPKPGPFEPPSRPPCEDTGTVTFGSFNTLAKLGERTVGAWARILDGVPGSRLLVKWRGLADAGLSDRLRARFAARGIAPERIVPLGWSDDPYSAYRAVDIALDPLVSNGGTTTCDGLWMGVPLVSLVGEGPFSRVGLCHLTTIGLPELLAGSVDGYVDLAVGLARNRARLAAVRAGLRERFAASPLMDAPRYVHHLEAAYRTMWRRWCAGLPAEAFAVTSDQR